MKYENLYLIDVYIKHLYVKIANTKELVAIIDKKLEKYTDMIRFVGFSDAKEILDIDGLPLYVTQYDYDVEKYQGDSDFKLVKYSNFSDFYGRNYHYFFATEDKKIYTTIKLLRD